MSTSQSCSFEITAWHSCQEHWLLDNSTINPKHAQINSKHVQINPNNWTLTITKRWQLLIVVPLIMNRHFEKSNGSSAYIENCTIKISFVTQVFICIVLQSKRLELERHTILWNTKAYQLLAWITYEISAMQFDLDYDNIKQKN
jgi:hypothetical protein